MHHTDLQVSMRDVLGKKVRRLRRAGITPGNLYGRNVPSTAIQMDARELAALMRRVGTSRLLNVQLPDGPPRPVIIRGRQVDPRTGQILHVDFYQVSMREKIKLALPVVMVGDAPALENTDGLLVRNMDTLEVEALPGDLPPTLEADVSNLREIGDTVTVADIKTPEGVTILAHPEDTVVTVAPPMAEPVEEEAAAPEAEEVPEVEETEGGE